MHVRKERKFNLLAVLKAACVLKTSWAVNVSYYRHWIPSLAQHNV